MSLNPETTLPRLERAAFISLATFVAALQISIALANILLTVTGVLWVALLIRRQERVTVPQWFWLLAAYAALTLMSSMMSRNRCPMLATSWSRECWESRSRLSSARTIP